MNGPNRQPQIGTALRWANQVTSIGLELAIPIGGGAWLDQKYGWTPGLTLVGVLIGGWLAYRGLLRLIQDLDKQD